MSWSGYCDDLVDSGYVDKAAICRLDDGSVWGQTAGFNVSVCAVMKEGGFDQEINIIVLYCIVSINLYSASCRAPQSEALRVRETQREESSLERTKRRTCRTLADFRFVILST